MATYRARYVTKVELLVEVEVDDTAFGDPEDEAANDSWDHAEAYLNTLAGDHQYVVGVSASLDGIGAETVELINEGD